MATTEHTDCKPGEGGKTWLSRLFVGLIVLAPLLFIDVEPASAHMYLNSAEPQCNGSDPTVVMCDDFETGVWYATNCDTAGGRSNPPNKGWCGSIYHTDAAEHDYGRCGGLGAVGTNCTSTTTNRSGGGEVQGQGFHKLGPQVATGYTEFYHREYLKFLPGYVFGHEKWTFYQADADNVNTQFFLTQTPFGSSCFDVNPIRAGVRVAQNVGTPLCFVPGRWYYMETHARLGTNGLIEIWADDCGTNGLGCTGPGTKRLTWSGSLTSSATTCCDFHQENWCPTPGQAGTCSGEVYRDQVVWATRRIGPMGSTGGDTTPPATPTGLRFLP